MHICVTWGCASKAEDISVGVDRGCGHGLLCDTPGELDKSSSCMQLFMLGNESNLRAGIPNRALWL
jgi:hypothetical protein